MTTIEDTFYDPLLAAIHISELRTATADGPIVSADGTLVVHRADPELARVLLEISERQFSAGSIHAVTLRRAARLVAGDPKEEEQK